MESLNFALCRAYEIEPPEFQLGDSVWFVDKLSKIGDGYACGNVVGMRFDNAYIDKPGYVYTVRAGGAGPILDHLVEKDLSNNPLTWEEAERLSIRWRKWREFHQDEQ